MAAGLLSRDQVRQILAKYYDEVSEERRAEIRAQSGERYEQMPDTEIDDIRQEAYENAQAIAGSLVDSYREKTVQGRPSRFVPYRGLRPRHPRPRRARGAA